ncbi:peptidoglycan DD-metalloendopeptidase family protein [Cognatishimia sp. WU-CL00825]
MVASATALLAACEGPFDLDLRGGLGQQLDTTAAATTPTAARPTPDNRGIISYPNYQVAVARRGDTVADVANRIGLDAEEVASYNAVKPDDALRNGEIVALPHRVTEPSAATGGSGQIISPSDVDISSLAGRAINSATPTVETETLEDAPQQDNDDAQVGFEPIRHTVERGETAFTISRLYNVSVRSLAEWNGLGQSFTIRENQILLIPPQQPSAPSTSPRPVARSAKATPAPGQGSPTPTPPSAAKPLPKPESAKPVEKPKSPDLGKTQTKPVAKTAMTYPVDGKIVRAYSKGKNNGIDISASAGSTVKAATDGTVAAITTDADDVKIVVIRHANNIMTVYYNVENINVSKGSKVTRGQKIAAIPQKDSYVHFEVRKGFDSVDPTPYLN